MTRRSTSNGPGLLELFSGAGGFSWGWHRAGYTPVAAIDNDVAASRSYEVNFGREGTLVLKRDLTNFGPQDLREKLGRRVNQVEIIAGGPPCQGWSRAGRGKIRSLRGVAASLLEDPRNQLYRRFLDFVGDFQVPVCVMENVPGMLQLEGVNVAAAVTRHFRDFGYRSTHALVNAGWFGVPQDRTRLIFIGVREDLDLRIDARAIRRFAARFRRDTTGLSSCVTVRHAIADLPGLENGESEDPSLYMPGPGRRSRYAQLMREGSGELLTDHVVRDHNEQDVEAFGTMKEGGLYVDLDPQYKRYRDDIFKDKYRRLYWNRRSWTVTAHLAKDGYSHIHPQQPRTLSIREAARLQSFPDSFRFFGNMGDRFRQIGNAVPPLMAWGIAAYVRQQMAAGAGGTRP